jgi:hypothetical protein
MPALSRQPPKSSRSLLRSGTRRRRQRARSRLRACGGYADRQAHNHTVSFLCIGNIGFCWVCCQPSLSTKCYTRDRAQDLHYYLHLRQFRLRTDEHSGFLPPLPSTCQYCGLPLSYSAFLARWDLRSRPTALFLCWTKHARWTTSTLRRCVHCLCTHYRQQDQQQVPPTSPTKKDTTSLSNHCSMSCSAAIHRRRYTGFHGRLLPAGLDWASPPIQRTVPRGNVPLPSTPPGGH